MSVTHLGNGTTEKTMISRIATATTAYRTHLGSSGTPIRADSSRRRRLTVGRYDRHKSHRRRPIVVVEKLPRPRSDRRPKLPHIHGVTPVIELLVLLANDVFKHAFV